MTWLDIFKANQIGKSPDARTSFIANYFLGDTKCIFGKPPLTFTASGEPLSSYKINGATVKNSSGEINGVGDYDTETGLYKIAVTASGTAADIYLSEPLYEGEYVEYPDKVVRKWRVLTLNGTEISNYSVFFGEKYVGGTPVKLWLPLDEPAVELIELPQISTIDGTNVFTVESSVQPPSVNIDL